MIVINDDRNFTLYYRQNKMTKWQYADYDGRYKSINDAIKALKEHINGQVEYRIEDMDGNIVKQATIII